MRKSFGRGARWAAQTPEPRRGRLLSRVALPIAGLLVALGMLLGASPTAHADGSAVNIVFPAPSGSNSSGPVGTNVTITATGLTGADKYVLGYATQSTTCAAGFQGITDTPFAVSSDGSYQATFKWPETAHDVGTSYVICLQDASQTGTPPVQSSQAFIVQSASAPAIALKHGPQPTATAGQPTPPASNSKYYSDEPIIITGTSFFTSGADVSAFLVKSPIKGRADLPSSGLQVTDGTLTPDSNGAFQATVQLPDGTSPGDYYLYVVSNDGQAQVLPSLVAFKKVTLVARPTPTATPTTKPSPTSTAAGNGGTTQNTGGIQNPTGVLALGALSLVLFVVGVMLLASAASTPRPTR